MRKLIITIVTILLIASCAKTKCVGSLHKNKYKHKNTCAAFR